MSVIGETLEDLDESVPELFKEAYKQFRAHGETSIASQTEDFENKEFCTTVMILVYDKNNRRQVDNFLEIAPVD